MSTLMRIHIISVLLVAAISFTASAQTQADSRSHVKELLARDINGYTLDMTMDQVVALAHKPLKQLGLHDFEVDVDGMHYDFEFSTLGHLYRIISDQNIGYFTPDDAYCKTLAAKMSQKFGIPNTYQSVCLIQWESLETYRASTGPLNREVMSLSARVVEEYEKPVSLEIFLIDRRIERRDLEKANEHPRSKAEGATKF